MKTRENSRKLARSASQWRIFPEARQRGHKRKDLKMREENNVDGGEERPSAVRITSRIELNFWRTCLLNAAGLAIAWATRPDIHFGNIIYFAALVVAIWFLNWLLKPIIVVFALPFIHGPPMPLLKVGIAPRRDKQADQQKRHGKNGEDFRIMRVDEPVEGFMHPVVPPPLIS